jgi:intracellular septation protein A
MLPAKPGCAAAGGGLGVILARYRRRFMLGALPGEVVVTMRMTGMESALIVGGGLIAEDRTPLAGPESTRNHKLAATLPDGRAIDVEMGYVSWWTVGIAVRLDGALVHQSHPGRRTAYPERAARMAAKGAGEGFDPGQIRRNKVPLLIDVALGLLFFVVAKLTDLSTAALVGAGAGLALVAAQRFVKVDLLGGLALFGIVMLLVSAGLALIFQDDMMVKMRSTIVGLVSAALFLGDGLLGGNRLGRGMARYLPYTDIDPGRLAFGVGLLGLVMAGLNYAVAKLTGTDFWLFYTTFVDFFLAAVMILAVFSYARGKLLPRGYRKPAR